jgi:hypothetical protein
MRHDYVFCVKLCALFIFTSLLFVVACLYWIPMDDVQGVFFNTTHKRP